MVRAQGARILLRHGERGGGDICRGYGCVGQLQGQGDSENPGAGSDVQDAQRTNARWPGCEGEHGFDQMLGLGAGNQHQRVDNEGAAIELLRADDVLHWLVEGAARDGGLVVIALALGELALRVRQQVGFGQARGTQQQQFCITVRGGAGGE